MEKKGDKQIGLNQWKEPLGTILSFLSSPLLAPFVQKKWRKRLELPTREDNDTLDGDGEHVVVKDRESKVYAPVHMIEPLVRWLFSICYQM